MYNVTSPCSECPFRKDIKPYLTKARAQQLVTKVIKGDNTFTCHKTLKNPIKSHCSGAVHLIVKEDHPNRSLYTARILGLYKEDFRNPDLVFDNAQQFIDAQH